MSGIEAALADLALAAVTGRPAPAPQMRFTVWGLRALALLCVVVTVLFLALALDRHLSLSRPGDAAALAVAAAFALAGLLAAAAPRIFCRCGGDDAPAVSDAAEELRASLRAIIGDALHEIEGPVRENPKSAMALAALAGFLAAEKFGR